jgi:hypothetical protein
MVSFQIEKWAQLIADGVEIFKRHYDELSLEKNRIPLGMDFSCYQDLEDKGYLHVLTCRKDGILIGYYIAIIIAHHPHYKDSGPMSTTDMFYILPEHRNGCGAKLLLMAEKTLKERGVAKATISVKLKQDHTELLEALGWSATDKVFQKVIGGKP